MRGAFVEIREFCRDDQDEVRGLILEGLREHFSFIDQSLNPDLSDIQETYLNDGHEFFVATIGREIVGTAGLLRESSGSARVVRMSVARTNRRMGIAGKLMRHLIRRAERRNCVEIVAFTEPDWKDAVGFYESFGFTQFGFDEVDIHLKYEI